MPHRRARGQRYDAEVYRRLGSSRPGGLSGAAEVDRAIGDWLRHETELVLRRLVELGPLALRRAVQLYYAGPVPDVVAQAQGRRHARELVDAWGVLLGRLARAYPQEYLTEIDAGRVKVPARPTLEIVILGGIDLPGAVAVLLRYCAHQDWLVRYHVVAGLGRRPDPDSVEAVQAAVTDPHPMVRDEAARWLQRRDPQAALACYRQLLADPDLPAQLRSELTRRVATAKRLARGRRRPS